MIGERAEDAVERVERFLDAAAMATVVRVRIVHGHGMGILKRAIADLLKASPHVAKFYPATQSRAGPGPRSWNCGSETGRGMAYEDGLRRRGCG